MEPDFENISLITRLKVFKLFFFPFILFFDVFQPKSVVLLFHSLAEIEICQASVMYDNVFPFISGSCKKKFHSSTFTD